MCGISGMLDLTNGISTQVLEAMNNVAKYRGPDDEGYFVLSRKDSVYLSGADTVKTRMPMPDIRGIEEKGYILGFGHRRLSIIDLTEYGHQPMRLGNLTVTYNGEIYNYKELRTELELTTPYRGDDLQRGGCFHDLPGQWIELDENNIHALQRFDQLILVQHPSNIHHSCVGNMIKHLLQFFLVRRNDIGSNQQIHGKPSFQLAFLAGYSRLSFTAKTTFPIDGIYADSSVAEYGTGTFGAPSRVIGATNESNA